MRHEPVTLIMEGIAIYEPGSNRQGTAAQHRDNTKWLVQYRPRLFIQAIAVLPPFPT
jgi:hypothetical protein